tara:strand:- start:2098 stop:2637 length:540 start_codon:yes stop_codon:yes gene_type:complete
MSSFNFKSCTIEQLWKYVATHLAKNDVDVILVGGAVVSIYTEGAYISGDLDFVLNDLTRTNLNTALESLGFNQSGRHFIHPDCKHLYLEFCPFPVSIGDDCTIVPAEVSNDGVKIKIFNPTDSVRDRLASYIHFKAKECIDQAVMVAKRHPVDLSKIKKWCVQESGELAFEEFIQRLKQ